MLKRWMPVLVVDDSTTMCAVMKKILLSLDFDDVEVRQSASEAIEGSSSGTTDLFSATLK